MVSDATLQAPKTFLGWDQGGRRRPLRGAQERLWRSTPCFSERLRVLWDEGKWLEPVLAPSPVTAPGGYIWLKAGVRIQRWGCISMESSADLVITGFAFKTERFTSPVCSLDLHVCVGSTCQHGSGAAELQKGLGRSNPGWCRCHIPLLMGSFEEEQGENLL